MFCVFRMLRVDISGVTRTVFVHGGSDGKGKLVLLDGLSN